MSQQPATRGGPIYWLKRRSRRFWIVATALLAILYPASLGPTCWIVGDLADASPLMIDAILVIYYPILSLGRIARQEVAPGEFAQSRIDDWVEWYATLARYDGFYPGLRANGERVWYSRD